MPFLQNTMSKLNVKCASKVNLVYLYHKDFMEIIKIYPKDFQNYMQLKDNLNL